MIALRVERLRKTYGRTVAVDDVSFTLEEGTTFGFLGPNGAGKTTTMRIIAGLAAPTQGQVSIGGLGRGARLERIGYLPEEPVFYPWMTPREFLDYVGSICGLDKALRQRRSTELLELVGLAQSQTTRIRGFSRGMRQRLGVAQSLMNEPEVLLLDEPVSALDPAGRKDVLELIAAQSRKRTILMSTHILNDVERVCDNVAIIDRGKLIANAKQEDLKERYARPVFEVEVTESQTDRLTAWIERVRAEPWVSSCDQAGAVVRVFAKDPEVARQRLLSSVVAERLVIQRFEAVKPSLEEVFLRILSRKEDSL